MRLYLFYTCCLLSLISCANYADLHNQTTPLDNTVLSTHHHYTRSQKSTSQDWWRILKDPALNHLIDVALNDSPTLQNAESRVRFAQQIAAGTNASLWPAIDANASVARRKFTANTFFPPPFGGNTFTQGVVGLNFNYEFDFWGKNRETFAAKMSQAEFARANVLATRLVLTTALATTYLQLQSNLLQLSLAQKILQERSATFNIIKDRTQNDIASEIPLTLANTDLQKAKIRVSSYREAVALSQHQLAVLMGKNALVSHVDTVSFHQRRLTIPRVIPANLLAQRPDVLAARSEMEVYAHEVNAAKARFFPNINLQAIFSMQSFGLNKLFEPSSQDYIAGAAIDLPIFDAGKRRANLGVQYAAFDEAVTQYNQTILVALRQTADQLSILHARDSELTAQSSAVRSMENNVKLTSSRFHHGIVDYTDVLRAKSILLEQQTLQIQLQTQRQQAVIALVKALGGKFQDS
ncbi:MAG: efflux transporter outer membrane subunit [Gammaproteobacteria bacterium]